MNQYEIAQILREIGILIELTDPFPQKAFAYRRAALSIEKCRNFNSYVKKKKLTEIPGVGEKIAKIVFTLARTGKLKYYEELKAKIPSSLYELINIPGLNPEKVRLFYEKLHIKSIEDLKKALEKGQLYAFKSIRPATIRKIEKSIAVIQTHGYSLSYPKAQFLAESFVKILKKIEITGELRRKCELVSCLSFIGVSKRPEKCLEIFLRHPAIKEVISITQNGALISLKTGIEAHLTLVTQDQFHWALFLNTGNEDHVAAILKEFQKKQIPLPLKAKTEETIYTSLHLEYIPPELRENKGEIKAAKEKRLPVLIEKEDLKGVFHCHTTDSDGIHTIVQMASAAKKMGWEYIGISDHSKSTAIANGMDEERLFTQVAKIRQLNKKQKDFHIFSGIECDILKDGTLDFSNDVLKQLDFVIVSIHSLFKMEKSQMTKRIIKAIENPYTTIIGHVTGRLLRHRDPYDIDLDKIIDACIVNRKVMELNCTPSRMDMDWRYWIKAKEKGLLCSINPDAHSIHELSYVQYGINAARKGWLEKKDVINTLSLKKMRTFLN